MLTKKEIEFNKMVNDYNNKVSPEKKFHQSELIEKVMRENKGKVWWYSYELMGPCKIREGEFFISYEAGARLREMEIDDIVEGRDIGKFKVWTLL